MGVVNQKLREASAPMHPLRILIVDDEVNIRKTLAYCLETENHTVLAVGSAQEAAAEARRQTIDIAFIDLRLGADDGLDLITVLLADSPWLKIIVITAYASIETAVEAMRRGAVDYIAKPFLPDQVRLITAKLAHLRTLELENASLREDLRRFGQPAQFSSENAAMRRLLETARTAAATDAIILLLGESGTGKSVFARALHGWSARQTKPFSTVSCPTLPRELLESELFGHKKGAFTGAQHDQPGRIAACEGGTLFLDEIGDMDVSVQAKLLRFIQEREYERLGDPTPRRADVRIIAATNTPLETKVAEGSFREDLYYRLNVISLVLIPLRERPEDIQSLAMSFLLQFNRANHKQFQDFSEDALSLLRAYRWPGNIRELRNVIERAVILGGGDRIRPEHLPHSLFPHEQQPKAGERMTLAELEERHVRHVLARARSIREAAEELGIDQATLWRRRKQYGI